MSAPNRRDFLLASAAGAAALPSMASLKAAGANERLRVGLIGAGGRGTYLAGLFRNPALNVDLVYMADPDANRLQAAAKGLGDNVPKQVGDLRVILDDKSIDAVIVATPDHWHAP